MVRTSRCRACSYGTRIPLPGGHEPAPVTHRGFPPCGAATPPAKSLRSAFPPLALPAALRTTGACRRRQPVYESDPPMAHTHYETAGRCPPGVGRAQGGDLKLRHISLIINHAGDAPPLQGCTRRPASSAPKCGGQVGTRTTRTAVTAGTLADRTRTPWWEGSTFEQVQGSRMPAVASSRLRPRWSPSRVRFRICGRPSGMWTSGRRSWATRAGRASGSSGRDARNPVGYARGQGCAA
jgi:hypothetical protein